MQQEPEVLEKLKKLLIILLKKTLPYWNVCKTRREEDGVADNSAEVARKILGVEETREENAAVLEILKKKTERLTNC